MKIHSATIYPLKIPFRNAFSHSLQTREYSDSIVVRMSTNDGLVGYGEGLPRSYVTGENVNTSTEYLAKVLIPSILEKDIPELSSVDIFRSSLKWIDGNLPEQKSAGIISWNAARSAIELALLDCLLKSQKMSFGDVLPAKKKTVTYSGVIPATTPENAGKLAMQYKHIGISQVKIKVGKGEDIKRIGKVREILGNEASLRIDANGAFNETDAIAFAQSVAKYNIASFEQPISRGNPDNLAKVRRQCSIPLMADESLVTEKDAVSLSRASACDSFNIRISKCGGIARTLRIARIADENGIGYQLGCQVGETAILSAAGRHMSAHLDIVSFTEGSFGAYLLEEDISRNDIRFGPGGVSPLLSGPGLGVDIVEELLKKYSENPVNIP